MNKKKNLMFSIIAVLVIGLVITGSTFAYLQWSSGYGAGTSVNVTIEMGGITMHIESEDTEFVGLYPTKIDDASDCDRARYGDALVTIVNSTGTMAVPSFKLKVKVTKGGSDPLTKDALSHIRYSVVPVTTTIDGSGNPVKGNEVSSCYAGVTGGSATGNKYDVESSWTTAGFKFESVSTTGAWSHIPVANDYVNGGDNKLNTGYLPRQYNTTTESVSGITFKAPQYSTTYQYYRVYVWLDEGYTTTIIGDTITDPLQNAKIEVMWSEESMVEQVTGSGTAAEYPNSVPMENVSEEELVPGLYYEDGDFTSWDSLITQGIVEVNGTELYMTNLLSGDLLVIPKEITKLSSRSFDGSSVKEIRFEKNSQLTTIDGETFIYCDYIEKITIPSSVTTINWSAFYMCVNLNNIYYDGTIEQWNLINKNEEWNYYIPAIEVICSNGVVVLKEPGLYGVDGVLMTLWDDLISNGKIDVSNTTINNVSEELEGVLVIPNEITTIGGFPDGFGDDDDGSFNSSNIIEVKFGQNSRLSTIEGYAFQNSKLKKIEIPSSVTEIGMMAFMGCLLEDNLSFAPNSQLTILGAYAFSGAGLTSIEIPASVMTLVYDCLSSNQLGDNLTFAPNSKLSRIEEESLYYAGLTSIEIPASVTYIGTGAFMSNDQLSNIYYKGTIAQWETIVKAGGWNDTLVTYVECSDGIVNLE